MKNILVILGAPFVVPSPVFLTGGQENKMFSQDNLPVFLFFFHSLSTYIILYLKTG